jgi:uncharacterized integral membrane protein
MATAPDERATHGVWRILDDGRSPRKEGQMDIAPRLAQLLVLMAATIVFVAQNGGHVRTRFLFIDGSARLWAVIFVSVALGACLGQLAGLVRRRRKDT